MEALSDLQKRRNAVHVLNPLRSAEGSLHSALEVFSPTVTLWDVDSVRLDSADIQALSSCNLPVACVTGGSTIDSGAPFPLIRWPFDFFHVDGLVDDSVFGENTPASTCGLDNEGDAPVLGIFQALSNDRLASVLGASMPSTACLAYRSIPLGAVTTSVFILTQIPAIGSVAPRFPSFLPA